MRARRLVDVLKQRAVRGAKLARKVQAKAGALRFGGEEGLEQLPLRRRGYAGPVVDHRELDLVGEAAQGNAHAARLAARVAHRVTQQVPHHLAQMLAVELDRGVAPRLE